MASKEERFEKRRLRGSYASTIVSISLVLFMLGLLGFIALHGKILSDYAKEKIEMMVILKDNQKEADILQFKKSLDVMPAVKSAEYVTKQQAADNFAKTENDDFIGILDFNPLPASINIHLHAGYTNPASLTKLKRDILKNDMVKEISYDKTLVGSMNDNLETISLVLIVFCALLFIISIALINNTIRLALHSKRFLIKTMQLVGATGGFIRKPFIETGIVNGIVAAIIASGLLAGIIFLGQREIPDLLDIELENAILFSSLFGIIFILGILISWISTYMAVQKYLRLHSDELY